MSLPTVKRNELTVAAERPELFQRPLVGRRCAIGQKIVGQALSRKRQGFGRQALVANSDFAGNVARRDSRGIRSGTAACRSRGQREIRSPACWSARLHRPSCRLASPSAERAGTGNRGPTNRVSPPENARCARRCRPSGRSEYWRRDRRRCDRLHRSRTRPIPSERRQSLAAYRPSCRSNYWPRRSSSMRPWAKCRNRTRPGCGIVWKDQTSFPLRTS